jgi:hypothetical protein
VTISYEEFGRRLIEAIVTADRVEHALSGFASGSFDTSMKLAAGLVRAEGRGDVKRITVDSVLDDEVLAFDASAAWLAPALGGRFERAAFLGSLTSRQPVSR